MKKFAIILLLAGMMFSGCQNQAPAQSPLQKTVPATQQNLTGGTMQTVQMTEGEQGMYVVFYQGALADVSLRYADAQVYTTALLTADPVKISREEWLKFSDLTNKKWEEAQQAAKRFEEISGFFPDREIAFRLLIPVAFAQDNIPVDISGQDAAAILEKNGQIQSRGLLEPGSDGEVQVLNKGITEIIDAAPPRQMLEAAARIFNTDIKGAYEKLQALRTKISDENYQWAQAFDDLSKTSEDIKLASEVALFIGGLATGGSELAIFGSAGKLKNAYNLISTAVSGADLTFSLTEKGVQLDLISEETGRRMADAADADFFKYLKVWSSIKDVNKAVNDYKDLYSSYQENKETLRRLKEIGGEAVDEAKLGREAFKNLMTANDKYKDLIQGGIGNVQTSYDLGSKVMDYLSTHPEAKSVSLQVQSDGTIAVQAGGNETVTLNDQGVPISDIQNNPQLQELSGLMNQMYSDAEVQLVTPAVQPAGADQPVVQTPVLVQPPSVLEPPVLVLPPAPEQPVTVIQPQPQIQTQSALQPQPPSLQVPVPVPAIAPVVEKPSYNGTYTGSSDAAVGVASGSVAVIGEDLSGRVTYRESAQGKTFTIGLSVYGSADGDGKVSGRFSGSQVFAGNTVKVSGSFSGGIYDNVMSLRFSGTSSATGGVSGSIKLYR